MNTMLSREKMAASILIVVAPHLWNASREPIVICRRKFVKTSKQRVNKFYRERGEKRLQKMFAAVAKHLACLKEQNRKNLRAPFVEQILFDAGALSMPILKPFKPSECAESRKVASTAHAARAPLQPKAKQVYNRIEFCLLHSIRSFQIFSSRHTKNLIRSIVFLRHAQRKNSISKLKNTSKFSKIQLCQQTDTSIHYKRSISNNNISNQFSSIQTTETRASTLTVKQQMRQVYKLVKTQTLN